MFEIAIGLGLILGLLAGGSLRNVFRVQLRYAWLLFLAVLLRFGIEIAIRYEIGPAESLRFPLYIASFGLLAGVLWLNRWQPGLLVAGAGIAANGIAIAMNGGWMPVWGPALQLVGMSSSDLVAAFHRLLPEQLGLEFLLRAGPFGDLIPIPFPLITNVASIGDAFIAAGLGWFVFASLVAPAAEEETEKLEALQESEAADVTGQPRAAGLPAGPPEGAGGVLALPAQTPAQVIASTPAVTGSQQLPPGWARGPAAAPRGEFGGSVATTASILAGRGIVRPGARSLSPRAGLRDAAALSRPARSGATRLSVAGPGALEYAAVTAAPGGAVGIGEALPRRAVLPARLADHPYVRLALDARFSAMWLGQLISLLGDRLNQVALGVLVYSVTGSALDVGLTFFAATLPNLLFGPFAGTFVDRWDQKRVMVVSDLLRAGLVLLVPLAAQRDVHLVYPVVFAVTTVSIFFRPARSAVLPRIVRPEDLNAANGATWTAENIADIGGYAFAGVFVAFLGTALTIAFWFDAASYLISAALLASITIPPVARSAGPRAAGALERFVGEVAEGWRFLTHDAQLLQNTLTSAVVQFSIGATIALLVVYARALDGSVIPYPQSYAALDMTIGVGNLVGGVVIGAIANRYRKGHLVVAGYLVMGLATIALGGTRNEIFALSCMLVIGVSNMVFLIPTQTLFAERTPPELMGRVVGTRFSIVFGSLTAAMGLSGVMAATMSAGAVFVVFGVTTVLAGFIGFLLPAVRNA